MRRSAKSHAAEVDLRDAVPVAARPAAADLALDQHHQLGIEAQDTVEALPAVGVGDLFLDLRRLEVGGQEDAHQPSALDLAVGRAFLGRVDDVAGLQVDRAVGQLAERALADLAQQRLAGERHQSQHDHRGACQLVLVAASEVAVGLEDVQMWIRGDALHGAGRLLPSDLVPRSLVNDISQRQRRCSIHMDFSGRSRF